MRFKVVPEPPAVGDDRTRSDHGVDNDGWNEPIATIARAQAAISLVPATEAECCVRLLDALELPARDAAREWLTFLRALGLVRESESGFSRRRVDVGATDLERAFRERVYGVRELLSILESCEGALPPGMVIERFGDHVPQWERHRYPDPAAIWDERVIRLLDWAVGFGLLERTAAGYRRVSEGSSP